jgi:predicted dehydrogenase
MKTFSVTIVGAGSIGCLKPDNMDIPNDDNNILTHAHALIYLQNKENKFSIQSIVDPDYDKQDAAAEKWGVKTFFNSIDSYLKSVICSDIIAICSPTETHLAMVKKILTSGKWLGLIVLEKPAGLDRNQCIEIEHTCLSYKVPILINYSRRFCKEITKYKEIIRNRKYGRLLNIVVRYTRGIKRDGCHAIDLINYLLDETPIDVLITNKNSAVIDLSYDDPTYPLHLNYPTCNNVFFVPCDGRAAAIFTIDMWFENKRIVFEDYGQRILEYTTIQDGIYGNYKTMRSTPDDIIHTSLNHNLVNLYRNAYGYLTKGEPLECTIQDARKVYDVIHRL